MKRTVLLVAYHFPPVGFSSGVQRALSLARYLPAAGWRPVVLTVWPGAYPEVNAAQTSDVPAGVNVYRAPVVDAKRHLAILGRYPGWLAVPDRWASWAMGARLISKRIFAREKPDLVWASYPITTAHTVGQAFAARFGLPLVTDFRDSMTEANYPKDPKLRQRFLAIEQASIRQSRLCTFTAPGTLSMYRERYPQRADSFRWLPNGYDEEIIQDVESELPEAEARDPNKPVRLVHSGTLYPSERDPTAFFDALAQLKEAGEIDGAKLQIILRATAHDEVIRPLIDARQLADMVKIEPPLDYRGALKEMQLADGLIIFQASNCNHQIPAKLYEYLRCRQPIMALTDPAGDTARTLREAGTGIVAPLDSSADIRAALPGFIQSIQQGTSPAANPDWIDQHSRRELALQTAALFDEVVPPAAP